MQFPEKQTEWMDLKERDMFCWILWVSNHRLCYKKQKGVKKHFHYVQRKQLNGCPVSITLDPAEDMIVNCSSDHIHNNDLINRL